MNYDKFKQIVEKRLDECIKTLLRKAAEYAIDNDRLANFRKAAALTNEPLPYVCWLYLTKHLVSISELADGSKEATPIMLEEKITDAINYLLLLEACLIETKDQTK